MDQNLINMIVVVAIVVIASTGFFTWVLWDDIKAAHRWSQAKKAHKLPNLSKGKSSVFGSRIKGKNT